jgi:hypothetical protein
MALQWTELYPLAHDPDGEQFLLDSTLSALRASRDPSLHSAVSASVPTVARLCQALDAHGVRVPYEVEWRLVLAFRLA